MAKNVPIFDSQNPRTVHDILWSWSEGYLSTRKAMRKLHAEDKMELYQAAFDNDVPFPGKASNEDREMAKIFLNATQGMRR